MEFWEQVVVGVILSSIAIVVLFVLLDKYVYSMWNRGRDYDNISRSAVSDWPVKVKNAIVKGTSAKRADGYTKVSDEDDAGQAPIGNFLSFTAKSRKEQQAELNMQSSQSGIK